MARPNAFSRRRCCVGQDLKEDDVIIAIDRKELGDDFTVELRESELVGADYLITCERPAGCCMLVHLRPVFVAAGKERGKPTHFSCLRGGGAHEFEVVLQPLPHVIPRCHGFDCKPSYGPLNYRTAARTLFLRLYLAHFCPVFSRFFAVFSVLTPGFQKVAPKDRGSIP